MDKEEKTVTFGAGVRYIELLDALVKAHMALAVLPSLPHLNVVGSVVTGTHGGCINCRQMASYVTQMKIIDANGNIRVINNKSSDFKSFLHSFGLLGVITEMTMSIEPEYAVRKCIYVDLKWEFI